MVRILALDASTTAVGWALGCDGELRSSAVFVPGARDIARLKRLGIYKGRTSHPNWIKRVAMIRKWLDSFCNMREPNVIVYETPSSRRNQLVTRKLGAVEWTILDGGRRYALPVYGIPQSVIKATGISKKGLEAAAAYKGYSLDEKNAGDEADALGALYWYFNVRKADDHG